MKLLLLVLLCLPAFPQQERLQEKGSVEGTVTDALTGAPVTRSQVLVNGNNAAGGRHAFTDAGGRFAVTGLPPGDYFLSAQHPVYPVYARVRPTSVAGFVLRAGEQKRDVALKLVPGAAVSGRVVDEEGEPVANCGLSLQPRPAGQVPSSLWAPHIAFNGQSDDKGRYRISRVPAGRYYLRISCNRLVAVARPFGPRDATPPLPSEGYPPLFYPNAPDQSAAVRLELHSGDEKPDLDFRLARSRVSAIIGRVDGIDPRCRVPVSVSLFRDEPAAQVPMNQSTAVRPSGEFFLAGVFPGAYRLIAARSAPAAACPPVAGELAVNVTAGEPATVIIALLSGLDLAGTVERDTPSTVPSKPANSIQLIPARIGPGLSHSSAIVEDDGNFRLRGVIPGVYNISSQGNTHSRIVSVTLGGTETAGSNVTIPPAAAGPLRITVSESVGSVEGSVPVEAGASNSRPYVSLRPLEPGPSSGALLQADGRFQISGVLPGRYRVLVFESVILQQGIDAELAEALAAYAPLVEVTSGQRVTAQPRLITARILEEAESRLP